MTMPLSEAKAVHFLETRCEVVDREYVDSSVRMRVRIGDRQLAQLRSSGARFEVEGEPAPNKAGAWKA